MNKPPLIAPVTYSLQEIADAYGVSYSHVQQAATRGELRAARRGKRLEATRQEIDAWWNARHERQANRRAGRVTRRDQQGKKPGRVKARTDYEPKVDDDIASALGIKAKTKARV